MGLPIGQPLPLHAGATARTLLAFAPSDVVEEVLSGDLEAFTPNTPDREALIRKLDSTRQARVTTSRGEMTPGSSAIAVPIFANKEVIAALCIAGPDSRCNRAWQLQAKPLLCEVGKVLGAVVDEHVAHAGFVDLETQSTA
jgi:DNA-binding IclR family transcriptional regulator